MKENIKKLWENYLLSVGENPENSDLVCKTVDYFGDEFCADELFELVYESKKLLLVEAFGLMNIIMKSLLEQENYQL